jgi:P27 family predicted phage terminase small subunit
MGRRGPAPRPRRLKILSGIPAYRLGGAPVPATGAPRCPAWLSKEAKTQWRAVVPELDRLGLLSRTDGGALASYCQALAELELATLTLEREGRYYRTPAGQVKAHPALGVQLEAAGRVRVFAAALGCEPASRRRREPGPAQDAESDELDDFLGEAGSAPGDPA